MGIVVPFCSVPIDITEDATWRMLFCVVLSPHMLPTITMTRHDVVVLQLSTGTPLP